MTRIRADRSYSRARRMTRLLLLLLLAPQVVKAQVQLVPGSFSAQAGAIFGDFPLDERSLSVPTATYNVFANRGRPGTPDGGASASLTGNFGLVSLDPADGVSSISFDAATTISLTGEIQRAIAFATGRVSFNVQSPTPYSISGINARDAEEDSAIVLAYDPFSAGEILFNPEGTAGGGPAILSASGTLDPGTYQFIAGLESATVSDMLRVTLAFEPSNEIRWNTGSGMDFSFSDENNWDPQQVPDANSTAIFEVPAAVKVSVGSQTVEKLRIGGSPAADVTFENTDLVVSSTSLTDPGLIINGGSFDLSDGRLNNTHAVIGTSQATEVTVGLGEWTNQGRLTVGAGGEAELAIQGGEVTSAESRIGAASNGASGKVTVLDKWSTGNLAVGFQSPGTLDVQDPGLVTSDRVDIGVGGEGRVRVGSFPPGAEEVAKLRADDDIRVGIGSAGRLDVVNGGDVRTQKQLLVGAESSPGIVKIVGQPEGNISGVVANQGFVVGLDSPGTLEITNGGILIGGLTSETSRIGVNQPGTVQVDGVEANDKRSELQVPALTIGEASTGELRISNGAIVRSTGDVTLGEKSGSTGNLILEGASDDGFRTASLSAGGSIFVGAGLSAESDPAPGGSGNVTIEQGGALIGQESLFVGGTGVGNVTVNGPSGLAGQPSLFLEESFHVGLKGNGTLTIQGGGEVVAEGISTIGGFDPDVTGLVEVLGTSSLSVQDEDEFGFPGDLIVGDNGAPGKLRTSTGANVSLANELEIGDEGQVDMLQGGIISIGDASLSGINQGTMVIGPNGTLVGGIGGGAGGVLAGANIFGTVINQGGLILPGNSPGTLIIDGDFIQGPDGTTLLEVGGTQPGTDYDQIVVSGNATIDGLVTVAFIDDFAPSAGDSFEFFPVTGETLFIGSNFGIEGFEKGFEFDFGLNDNGNLQLTALNDGIFAGDVGDPNNGAVPEPSTFLIWIGLAVCLSLTKLKKSVAA